MTLSELVAALCRMREEMPAAGDAPVMMTSGTDGDFFDMLSDDAPTYERGFVLIHSDHACEFDEGTERE